MEAFDEQPLEVLAIEGTHTPPPTSEQSELVLNIASSYPHKKQWL